MSSDMDLVQQCVLHLQSLRTERVALDDRTQELEKEKLHLQRLLEEQQPLQLAGEALQVPRRLASSLTTRDTTRRTEGAGNISFLNGQFLQLRRELHKVQAKVTEVEEKKQAQQNKQTEKVTGLTVLSKMDVIITDNLTKLEAEQGALAQMLQVMKGVSDTLSVKRADLENVAKNLEVATGRAEEEVWRRSLKETFMEEEQQQVPAAISRNREVTERDIEEELEVKRAELHGLTIALKQSTELITEMKKCHISSVCHEREVELEAEIRMVEEDWQREKEELQVELQDISEVNKELEQEVQEKSDAI